jgi:hypothetical protein
MDIARRAHSLLDLKAFVDTGTALSLGTIDLVPPVERQYVLRMAIRAQGGPRMMPDALTWTSPMLDVALRHQATIDADHPFCYVTVRHGIVDSVSDDDWHVDGFSMKVPHVPEQNYVWCSHTGTECVPLEVAFPDDFDPMRHNIHEYLARFVDDGLVVRSPDRTVQCMDPYVLHRRPAATAGTNRTFVRISFVPIEIDDVNNTQNPLLPRVYGFDGVAYRNHLEPYAPIGKVE